METRAERDSMGEMQVPKSAYFGAQTQRAVENFSVSGQPIPTEVVRALGMIKKAAAKVNLDLGLLDKLRAAWTWACWTSCVQLRFRKPPRK